MSDSPGNISNRNTSYGGGYSTIFYLQRLFSPYAVSNILTGH